MNTQEINFWDQFFEDQILIKHPYFSQYLLYVHLQLKLQHYYCELLKLLSVGNTALITITVINKEEKRF